MCERTARGAHRTSRVAVVVPAERSPSAGPPQVCSQRPGVETARFWYKKVLSRQAAGSNPFVRQQQGNLVSSSFRELLWSCAGDVGKSSQEGRAGKKK